MESKFIRGRQGAVIDAVKKQVDEEKIGRLADEKVPKAQIARDLMVLRMSVYRASKNGIF